MSTHRLYFSSDPVNAEMTGPAGCSERSTMKNRCLVFSKSKPTRPGKMKFCPRFIFLYVQQMVMLHNHFHIHKLTRVSLTYKGSDPKSIIPPMFNLINPNILFFQVLSGHIARHSHHLHQPMFPNLSQRRLNLVHQLCRTLKPYTNLLQFRSKDEQ